MCSLEVHLTESHLNYTASEIDGTVWQVYKNLMQDTVVPLMMTFIPTFENHPWVFAMIGSSIIGLSGIFPLLVIPVGEEANLKTGASGRTLKLLLSFAVGCLLGDVFLHLLPEVWERYDGGAAHPSMEKGLWVLAGLLIFIVLEKMFTLAPTGDEGDDCAGRVAAELLTNGKAAVELLSNGCCINNNVVGATVLPSGLLSTVKGLDAASKQPHPPAIHVSGYLNLMANSFDNFTHGLAVGGSFLVSFPHGVLTTLAILLHEIPHEVGDFAILLKSGFSRWDAARAQMCTAAAGTVGAMTAVILSGASGAVAARTSWILPFTAGGFIHIAMVTVLPDLLKEDNPRESLLQLLSLLGGISVMAVLSTLEE